MCKVFKVIGKLVGILGAIYAALFAVFYFDLDSKLLYYVVYPLLNKHYDNMPHKDLAQQDYTMGKKF